MDDKELFQFMKDNNCTLEEAKEVLGEYYNNLSKEMEETYQDIIRGQR